MAISDFLILGIILTIFAIISYVYWKSSHRLTVTHYVSAISTVGVILVIAGFIYSYQRQLSNDNNAKEQQLINLISETQILNEQLFMKYYPHLEHIYHQMQDGGTEVRIDNRTIHAAQIILQNFENAVTALGGSTADWSSPSRAYWLNLFRRWFSSPTLRYMWVISQRLYGRDTAEFYNKYIEPTVNK